jgi:predicted tellurium resistance membrane protein TerC
MFENLFTIDSLITFLILTALETVLGFDNLLYISIESKKVDPAREASVRRTGILLAIGLRIVLLFVVLQLIAMFQKPIWEVHSTIFGASVSGHSLIVLFGGVFLIYTAIKEIYHMIGSD